MPGKEPEESKLTTSGASPMVGVALAIAVGRPTGIVVVCQVERSQIANKERAIQMLRSQLYELELRKQNEAKAKVEAGKKKIEWGSQIRNYVFHPYKLVKDLRTGTETSDVQKVMDGDLNQFIKPYLMEYN